MLQLYTLEDVDNGAVQIPWRHIRVQHNTSLRHMQPTTHVHAAFLQQCPQDLAIGVDRRRSAVDLKDKWRVMKRRRTHVSMPKQSFREPEVKEVD